MTVVWAPLIPWWAVAALAGLAVLMAAVAYARGLRGWAFRGLAGLAAAAALAGPQVETGERRSLDDIVILLEDASASQSLPGRPDQTTQAVEAMARALAARPGTEVRRVRVGDDPDGTKLATALSRAIAAEPADRLAGVIAVTDGLAHDAAQLPATAPAPVHVLLTGQPGDWDRRLVIEEAPAFGLIGQPVTLRVRIEDQGAIPPEIAGRPATLRLSRDGGEPQVVAVPPGVPLDVPVIPDHAGANVIHLAIDPVPGQLTDRNDMVALTITGVRDRLRVLLVSGAPHAGERTWRNLLKSDAGVDLIHFTILRPPDKFDGVPTEELALIAFPTRELFMERIEDFDLIIFDRYRVQGILPPEYYENIADYVRKGGAILVAAGPEMAGVESLNLSPLGDILPARPTGRVIEEPFRPVLTAEGARHPVTAGLEGRGATPTWGRWLRMAGSTVTRGTVAMTGPGGAALLVLDRVGEGRVAQMTSDQVWLWGRGFDGGGPQLELLRRIAHWSMKEPDLEEESLTADILPGEGGLRITRRTLAERVGPVRLTAPDGTTQQVTLAPAGPGRFSAEVAVTAPGLYRLAEDDLTRVVALGPPAPREFEAVVADATALAPLVAATGGGVVRLSDGIPTLRDAPAGRQTHGQGATGPWIALTPRGAGTVTGLTRAAILPVWGWLVLIAGLALAAWLREGRA